MSSSGDSDAGAREEEEEDASEPRSPDGLHPDESESDAGAGEQVDGETISKVDSRVLEYLREAQQEQAEDDTIPQLNGTAFKDAAIREKSSVASDEQLVPGSPRSFSTPDDTPSILESGLSSPSSSAFPHNYLHSPSLLSPAPSLRPFERRFSARSTDSSSPLRRSYSPAFLATHSRTSSLSSRLDERIDDLGGDLDSQAAPWDVIRWTKLKKVSAQVYSEIARRNFGTPTSISASTTIAIGTTKGIVLIFDYHQNLKSTIGVGTKAIECGAVTSLAISADHTTIAAGHAKGHIFTWELSKPAKPFLQIGPIESGPAREKNVDGHVHGVSVLHLGFLGTRHTALVSADDKGMAFSHIAGRGITGRVVKTSRILGRYPEDTTTSDPAKPRKPSSVLGFGPLPLGNAEQANDKMGLVAMLTPYLLVIVSTTPVARTQHKIGRPKELSAGIMLSGCLSWSPATKLKQKELPKSQPNGIPQISKAKLAYSWSNILSVMSITDVQLDEGADPNTPRSVICKTHVRKKFDESIVAIQWLNRRLLAILTVTQRLLILEEATLHVTEAFDLMPKQLFHTDVFSSQLRAMVSRVEEEGADLSTVADAFFNSFRTFKGRIFLLCQYEVTVGTLSNWADRLKAMMEGGDFIGAIHLATQFYNAEVSLLTVGLPEDDELRHPQVRENLIEIMSASLRYAFGRNEMAKSKERLEPAQLRELAEACFAACIPMGATDFLFDDAFDAYEEGDSEGLFLETLEPFILDGRITSIPPGVIKALVAHYTSLELDSRLEEMICNMDTATMDIDQITTLCKRHGLFDALIYVWNRALGDYITPLIELLRLVIPLAFRFQTNGEFFLDPKAVGNAQKLFPYLSYVLTGRSYPSGDAIDDHEALQARASIYYFLFLGQSIPWPRGSSSTFLTMPKGEPEPSFPYLRLILHFNAPDFLSLMNEAFEDPFLNDSDLSTNGTAEEVTEDQIFGQTVNRQFIVSILLEVMNPSDFPAQDTIYLDIFIARNLPKFPQFMLLSSTSLHRVLKGLCNFPGQEIADDCQLSVEYLLQVYRPPDMEEVIELFTKAGFYRVLRSIYRSEKQYGKLITAYLEDIEARDSVFQTIGDCLRPKSGLSAKQKEEVKLIVKRHINELVNIDIPLSAKTFDLYLSDYHKLAIPALKNTPEEQFLYLRTLFEPQILEEDAEPQKPSAIAEDKASLELYIRLMCQFDSEHVSKYVENIKSGQLDLSEVLPAMEASGAVDGAVLMMAREGQVRAAMDKLLSHLQKLGQVLLDRLAISLDPGRDAEEWAEGDLAQVVAAIKKYAQVGIWLCQGQTQSARKGSLVLSSKDKKPMNAPLSDIENLWLDLLDGIVRCVTESTKTLRYSLARAGNTDSSEAEKAVLGLRIAAQECFSNLLAATSSTTLEASVSKESLSFLRVLRAFLTRLGSDSSPSIQDLRSILSDIFSTYAFEQQLLTLSNKLLEKDLFIHVAEAAASRQKGWRPVKNTCDICGRRVWGPGAAGGIFSAWEKAETRREEDRIARRESKRLAVLAREEGTLSIGHKGKGKGKAAPVEDPSSASTSTQKSVDIKQAAHDDKSSPVQDVKAATPGDETQASAILVFPCRHIFHKNCLEEIGDLDEDTPPTTAGGNVVHKHHLAASLRGQGYPEFKCVLCG